MEARKAQDQASALDIVPNRGKESAENLPVKWRAGRRFTPGGAVRRFMVNSIFCDSRQLSTPVW